MILKDFGIEAQQKLLAAKVLVIGAGGLGCPALLYLAGAGLGTIGIIDDDTVSLENLHRQTLYTTTDIGFLKVERAAEKLHDLNPDISLIPYPLRLTTADCLEIFPGFDIILDCTDNFATRYMINDACVLLGKPLVSAAVSQYEGQLSIFNATIKKDDIPVNYRDLFPEPPMEGEVLNCAEAGILGVLPGIIGSMQAGETIKLITGIGDALVNRLFTYNMLNNQTYELLLTKRNAGESTAPTSLEAFLNTDYNWLCGNVNQALEINFDIFDQLIENGDALIIDVRETNELPYVTEFSHQNIPLSKLKKSDVPFERDTIIFFCQAGSRSLKAAQLFSEETGKFKNIYSLRGGILNWKKNSKRISYE